MFAKLLIQKGVFCTENGSSRCEFYEKAYSLYANHLKEK
jgi:hypothetical protein